VTVDGGVTFESRRVASAGQYRKFEIPMEMDGSMDAVDRLAEHWEANDWIDLVLSGVVESEQSVLESIGKVEEGFRGKVRKLVCDRSDVQVVSGILEQPIARSFLKAWRDREPDTSNEEQMAVWMRARTLGLSRIKDVVEARG